MRTVLLLLACLVVSGTWSQVSFVEHKNEKKVDVMVQGKLFTSFWYPDSLEKPVLYPLNAPSGRMVSRGFPYNPLQGELTDHPHHLGLWFNYENVNGLDFWNNSYAIPAERKNRYGWIKTTGVKTFREPNTGILTYDANWTNDKNEVLLKEITMYEFSKSLHSYKIVRSTKLIANTEVSFNDAKDGMLGIRMAHELQIPTTKDQKFTDDKGNETIVKAVTDNIAVGNYITSEGKMGDSAWSTRGVWCKAYGKMGNDSVSIIIIDHPKNPNYPTFWHARGYGLFAANPLGEKVFTNGKSEKNLKLKKGESVVFRYEIIIDENNRTFTAAELNKMAADFGKRYLNKKYE